MPDATAAEAAALVAASPLDGNDVKVVDLIVKVTALRVGALGVAQPAVPGATCTAGQRANVAVDVGNGAEARAVQAGRRRASRGIDDAGNGQLVRCGARLRTDVQPLDAGVVALAVCK